MVSAIPIQRDICYRKPKVIAYISIDMPQSQGGKYRARSYSNWKLHISKGDMQKPSYLDLVTQAPCILTESLSLQRAKRPCKIWCECLGLRLCGCDLVNFNVYQYLLPHFFHSMVATTLFFGPLLYNTIPAIHLYIESSSFSLCYHVSRPLGEFVFSCLPFCSYTLCFLLFLQLKATASEFRYQAPTIIIVLMLLLLLFIAFSRNELSFFFCFPPSYILELD